MLADNRNYWKIRSKVWPCTKISHQGQMALLDYYLINHLLYEILMDLLEQNGRIQPHKNVRKSQEIVNIFLF